MKILVNVKGKQIHLGDINLKNKKICCNGMIYPRIEATIEGVHYIVNNIAYSDCSIFKAFVYELYVDDSILFCLLRFKVKDIQADRFEYIVKENPKEVMSIFVSEVMKYSSSVNDESYGRMFVNEKRTHIEY